MPTSQKTARLLSSSSVFKIESDTVDALQDWKQTTLRCIEVGRIPCTTEMSFYLYGNVNQSISIRIMQKIDGKLSNDTPIELWIAAAALPTFGFWHYPMSSFV